jgi:PAS domain S-box-containing protein
MNAMDELFYIFDIMIKDNSHQPDDVQLLHSIFESPINIIIFSIDKDYCYTWFTRSHQQTMKNIWSADISLGMNMLDVILDPKDSAKAKTNFDRALKGETFILIEEYGDVDLSREYYENYYSPVRDSSDNIIGVSVFVINATDRVKTSMRLAKSQEGLRRLSQAVEQSPAMTYITNLSGNIEYVNRKVMELTGFSSEELIGNNPRIFGSGKKSKEEYKILWETISSGREWKGEFLNKKKNGEPYWVSASISPVLDENGAITHYLAVEEDVTERKSSEREILELNANLELRIDERTAALEEALSRLQKIASRLPGMVYQYQIRPDGTSCFPFASEGIRDIYRVSPEEVADDATIVFSRIHPEDIDGVGESIQKSASELTLWRHDYRVKFEDGTVNWVSGNALPQKAPDGSVTWHGFIADITEYKLAEDKLHWNQSLMRLMATSSPLGFLVVDNRTDEILYFNERFCQIWGIEHLIERMRLGELKNNDIIPDCLAVLTDIPAFAESCKPLQFEENRIVVQDEIPFTEDRTIQRFTTQIRGENDEYYGRFYIFEDITQRKRAEEEISEARKEADKANHAKSEFLSRMSHELRTPMNSILGFAQLLNMGQLTPGQKKGVNHILKSGNHLLTLINEVLDISRIEAGRMSLSLEPVSVFHLVGELVDSIHYLAEKNHLTIEIEDPSAGRLFVMADQQRLKQVLLNLLSNAIKYNRPGGSVIVKTEMAGTDENGSRLVRISIKDTGVGISPEDIPKLFTPFERFGAGKSETEGTGLGLAVVRKLMDAMGGVVQLDSHLGVGSTFWIELPLIENHVSFPKSIEVSGHSSNSSDSFEGNLGTILYIEDNVSNIELVENILFNQREGIRLVYTTNGHEALEFAIEHKPDLILLDLDLPGIHGTEVFAKLQANAKTKSIPVVIISADAMPKQIETLMMAGAKDYLTKPLDILMFLQMVDEWVKH